MGSRPRERDRAVSPQREQVMRQLNAVDPSTITRLADRMVAAGYVARGTDPRHRGVVTLKLTASGRDLVAAAGAVRGRELAKIMARLAPPERAAVTAALSLLVRAAGDEYGVTGHRPVLRDPLGAMG